MTNMNKIAKFLTIKSLINDFYKHKYNISEFNFKDYDFKDPQIAEAFMALVEKYDAMGNFENAAVKYDLFSSPIIKKDYQALLNKQHNVGNGVNQEAICKLYNIIYVGGPNPVKELNYLKKHFSIKLPKNYKELNDLMDNTFGYPIDEYDSKDAQKLCDYLHIKNEKVEK